MIPFRTWVEINSIMLDLLHNPSARVLFVGGAHRVLEILVHRGSGIQQQPAKQQCPLVGQQVRGRVGGSLWESKWTIYGRF